MENRSPFLALCLLLSGTGLAACGGGGAEENPGDSPSAGGAAAAGGSTATGGSAGSGGGVATGGSAGSGGSGPTGGSTGTGGDASTGGDTGTGGDAGSGGDAGTGGDASTGGAPNTDCTDTGAAENFSFFLTSYHHIKLLSGSNDGFGGDLRYGGATDGLTGADNICQEIATRVCHGHKTWKAYLSTSTVNAKDRIGSGPWYDYDGNLVANDINGLMGADARPAGGCCDDGIYDETGVFHDGSTDVNDDGQPDDDHDVLTATKADGTYDAFSCEDWTSTTATPPGGGFNGGLRLGHAWPAQSGQSWQTVHGARSCAAGTNFIQNGAGNGDSVGSGGGYGAIYCFAAD